ncbi:MAG: Hypothetical protein BHV28_02940 [Candidatus Tokpelaia hoelldobleri]|uniref:LysM domain-containing protein n=1 Tax=Candidatus Tokpelaia hoelldobleri TaxID=1902579 RepID=A0A1U9JT31_9HYPH|nr:MAG: Hypothetical protein BHV28_02940 [Candidatus Tokpelaia hoelldoblerii]
MRIRVPAKQTNVNRQKYSGTVRRILLLGTVSLTTLAGCSIVDIGGLTPSDAPQTVDLVARDNQMSQLGASQHPRILATYGGEYHDAQLERMVARIVGKLTATSDNPNQTYRITILNSPNINAFALPGGYIYVTRGLLALADDSAEVAAVIAHEMAHVTANHGLQRQQKEAEVALANRVVSEVLSSKTIEQQTTMRGKLNLARFSRNQELQADQIGIKMIGDAGYDPFASPRFLEAMEAWSRYRNISGATNEALDFLASHPATPRRIQLAITQARKVGAPAVGSTDRNRFLDGINGLIYGDTPDEGYIRGQTFIHPRLAIAFSVPGGFLLDNSAKAVIATGPDNMAIRFDSVALAETMTPPDYIESGWVSGLQEGTTMPLQINGLPAASAKAENGRWVFDICVIIHKNRAYRFLTAAPKGGNALTAVSHAATQSFRALSAKEVAALKPLRIRVVTVKAGDTIGSLAQRMQGTANKVDLFRIINGLPASATLSAGDRVKIIAE